MFLNRLFQVRRVIEERVPISGLEGRRRDEEDQGPLHLHGRERRSRPAGGAGENNGDPSAVDSATGPG